MSSKDLILLNSKGSIKTDTNKGQVYENQV